MTTQLLAAAAGMLLLVAVIQYAGVGRGFRWAPDPGEPAHLNLGAIDQKPFQMPPASAFADIEARPLFNDDRKPTPLDATAGDIAEEAPANPLNVILTGVIVTPELRIAMLRDNARNESVTLKVGMPLEGDQASWTLIEVKPQGATFRNAANETTQVELQAAGAANAPLAAAGARGRGASNPRANAKGSPVTSPAATDLAQRIEERRRQMREEAEKLRNQNKTPASDTKNASAPTGKQGPSANKL